MGIFRRTRDFLSRTTLSSTICYKHLSFLFSLCNCLIRNLLSPSFIILETALTYFWLFLVRKPTYENIFGIQLLWSFLQQNGQIFFFWFIFGLKTSFYISYIYLSSCRKKFVKVPFGFIVKFRIGISWLYICQTIPE